MIQNQKGTEGFLLINKPEGIRSFAIINRLRRITGIKKIGHAGTLDPFASGLMIVAIGKTFTKQIDNFLTMPKAYQGTIVLGIATDTLDSEGAIVHQTPPPSVTQSQVTQCLDGFIGTQIQQVPAYSAKKIDGKPMYKLAREGKKIPKNEHEITIFSLSLDNLADYSYPQVTISTGCSKGTYIRQLAKDIGSRLDSPAYLKSLKRTAIGPYSLHQAIPLEDIDEDAIRRHRFF